MFLYTKKYRKQLDNIYKIVYIIVMEKIFRFDVILEEEDLCNREAEKQRLISLMKRNGRIVVYSPRRMGKTSLLNVCSKKIRSEDPKSFHLYVDLNEVASLSDVAARFRSHYEASLKEQFPVARVKSYLNALLSKIKVSLPGNIELSLDKYTSVEPQEYLMSLFRELRKMSEELHLAIIIDEFQGIADLKEAQALLRRELKAISKAVVVLMGSNQRLLYKMFNDKKNPFFGFGEDLELKPIPVDDYLPYMNERFGAKNIVIDRSVALYLIEKMNGISNYINELGAWIVETMHDLELTQGHIEETLEAASRSKGGRYESALYGYSLNQKKFIKAIARLGFVKAHTGSKMIETTRFSPVELSRVNESLEDAPILSRDIQNRLYIIDPFLRRFLEVM